MALPQIAHNGRVLVIDERPLRRSMLADHLDRLGYAGARAAAGADDGGAAVWPDPEPPALVIISIGGNRLDAEGPARDLVQQAIRVFPSAPLVLISDLDNRSQVVAALALGVKGFIHTDVSAEVMSLSLQLVQSGGSVAPTRPFLDGGGGGDARSDVDPPAKKNTAPIKRR